jgi:hypothetical protein
MSWDVHDKANRALPGVLLTSIVDARRTLKLSQETLKTAFQCIEVQFSDCPVKAIVPKLRLK